MRQKRTRLVVTCTQGVSENTDQDDSCIHCWQRFRIVSGYSLHVLPSHRARASGAFHGTPTLSSLITLPSTPSLDTPNPIFSHSGSSYLELCPENPTESRVGTRAAVCNCGRLGEQWGHPPGDRDWEHGPWATLLGFNSLLALLMTRCVALGRYSDLSVSHFVPLGSGDHC